MSEETVLEMFKAGEVQRILKIGKSTLMRWRRSGKIKYVEFPKNKFRYPKSEVDRILTQGVSSQ